MSSSIISNCDADDGHSNLCIICCRPFSSNQPTQNNNNLSKLFEEFLEISRKGNEKYVERLNVLIGHPNSPADLRETFRTSFCTNCLTETNELITSRQKVSSLEDRLINLQKQIIQGLRDLEECLKGIKYHQQIIKKKLESSDESTLNEGLGASLLKIRGWIVKEFLSTEGKLTGNLWIPEETPVKQPVVKMEQNLEDESLDLEDNSSNFWDDADEDMNTSSFKNESEENQDQTSITSKMTLRTRRTVKKPIKVPTTPVLIPKKRKLIKPKNSQMVPSSPKISKTIKKSALPLKKEKRIKVIRSCELCPIKTRDDTYYEQHIREHETEIKTLECPQCPLKFTTNQSLKFHQDCHQGYLKMVCDVCRHKIPILSLEAHIKSHLSEEGQSSQKIIYCQNCSFCCTKREVYLTHIRRHYAGRKVAGKFSCDICSKEYPNPSGLLKHFHEEHKGTLEKYTCDVPHCGKTFSCRQFLVTHKWNHAKQNSVECPKCDKKFSTVNNMEVHFLNHSGEKPFSCDECSEGYRDKAGLNAHKRRDHGAEKFKCKICGKEYVSLTNYKYHLNKHENKGFHCEICGRICGNRHKLKDHMICHSEEKKVTCEQCGKGFKGRGGLREHLKVHAGVKNWNCEYCGKGFVRRENLRDHLRVHTGERPFVCETCGKDFNQASALKTHKKNQHAV